MATAMGLKKNYTWHSDQPEPTPRALGFQTGEDSEILLGTGKADYRYWVRVQNGLFSDRRELMLKIEAWLEHNKVDFECALNRYYFKSPADVTMLLLRWS